MSNRVGPYFNPASMAHADAAATALLAAVGSALQPGLRASGIRRLVRELGRAHGVERHWHAPVARVGAHTTLGFRDAAPEDSALQESDICFVDIGPVFGGHEADRGATFVLGGDEALHHLAGSAQRIWDEAASAWAQQQLTGRALYALVHHLAEREGLQALPSVRGHRIGDFPHGAYVRGPLARSALVPPSGLWVLEVHVVDARIGRGAFYEAPLVWPRSPFVDGLEIQ